MRKVLLLVLLLFGHLPVTLRALAGRFLGRIFSLIPNRDREIAFFQLARFFGKKEAARIVPRVYGSLGETLFEALNLKPLLKEGKVILEDVDRSVIERVLASGKGVVNLAAHTGNWELLAAETVRRGLNVAVIAREARSAVFQEALRHIRAGNGVQTIWRGNKQGILEVREHLKKRGIISVFFYSRTH